MHSSKDMFQISAYLELNGYFVGAFLSASLGNSHGLPKTHPIGKFSIVICVFVIICAIQCVTIDKRPTP